MSVWDHTNRRKALPRMTDPSHPSSLTPFTLAVDPKRIKHPEAQVSEYLYSGFLEHLGKCIYGGIVDDPAHPSPASLLESQANGKLGYRTDVKKLISRDGELEIPMLRWPGGNFVSNYHWQDGIGPLETRPKRIELAWLSDESNLFGTDEYIDYCRSTGCEPYICLNMGTGTYEEALAWVEYCNGKGNTHWANLRRKNTGRDEPHNVKYWGLGNEVWGPWQVGQADQTEYAKKAKVWAHGLKLVDPSIKLVSCGEQGNSDWDREVLQTLVPFVDLHSIHFYSTLGHKQFNQLPGHDYEKSVFGPAAAERNIEICKSIIDLANIQQSSQGIPPREVKIAFDEWGVWDDEKGHAENGLQQSYDYTDMLAFVAWLNLLVRKHKDIGLACLAQSVNVISPIHTKPDGILLQTTYYPLKLFSRHMKNGHLLDLPSSPDAYTGPTHPNWIEQIGVRPTYIDLAGVTVASEGKDGSISLRISVLNRHPSADWTAQFKFDGFTVESAEVHEMYSDDLSAQNTWEAPKTVVPEVKEVQGAEWKGEWTVRKHSWCFFILTGRAS